MKLAIAALLGLTLTLLIGSLAMGESHGEGGAVGAPIVEKHIGKSANALRAAFCAN